MTFHYSIYTQLAISSFLREYSSAFQFPPDVVTAN
jgi:hypothetical protein